MFYLCFFQVMHFPNLYDVVCTCKVRMTSSKNGHNYETHVKKYWNFPLPFHFKILGQAIGEREAEAGLVRIIG